MGRLCASFERAKTRKKEIKSGRLTFDDRAGDVILDLAVARNRLAHFRARVLIPIGLAAVPDENATHARELLD